MIALLWTLVASAAALSVPTIPRTADVGVIGAGPAGLVLAHALRERGHSVRIFERRDSFRPVGAAVFMHPFALNSLRAISPALEKRMLDVCTTIHTLSFTTLAEDAPSFRLDTLGDAKRVLGAPFVTVRFWDMLCALRHGLPDELFCFGHELEQYEQLGDAEGGMALHLADAAQPPVRVRYLIDAGGIRSATRKQLLGDERIPRLRATFSVLPAERVTAAHRLGLGLARVRVRVRFRVRVRARVRVRFGMRHMPLQPLCAQGGRRRVDAGRARIRRGRQPVGGDDGPLRRRRHVEPDRPRRRPDGAALPRAQRRRGAAG